MNPKILICVLVFMLSLCSSSAIAAGPWQLVMSMPDKDADVVLGDALALTVDAGRQRYYVVDSNRGKLLSFGHQGELLAALNPGNRLQKPVSLAVAPGGILWVVDRATNQLVKVNLQKQQVLSFDLVSNDGLSVFADKVAVDQNRRVFVLDRSRGVVLRLDDNLKIIQEYVGKKPFQGFVDFRLTADGLWALDSLSRSLTLFSDDGKLIRQVTLAGNLEFPVAFEVDGTGMFYLLDRHAGKVVVFNGRGDLSYDFLLKGKRQGRLWYPASLLLDWAGRLCVVNEGNGRIDIYSR